jgi:hypothetical protein
MIWLNPVTDVDESFKRGLVAITTDLENMLRTEEFKEPLRLGLYSVNRNPDRFSSRIHD